MAENEVKTEEKKEGECCGSKARTAIEVVLFVLLAALFVYNLTLLNSSRKESDTKITDLTANLTGLQKNVTDLQGGLNRATSELELYKQLKVGLDALAADMNTRVAGIETTLPEKDAEVDELGKEMTELNRSLNDLSEAIAMLKMEKVTQEQLDQARTQIDKSLTTVRTSVKGLDRAQARIVGRVKKLEKTTTETTAIIEQLTTGVGELKTRFDDLRKVVDDIKAAPKAGEPELKFEPTTGEGGTAPAGGTGTPTEGGAEAPAPAPEAAPAPAPEPPAAEGK